MPRRKSVNIIRNVGVDPRFNSENIQKFINVVMWRGKKNTARRIVYDAFEIMSKKLPAAATPEGLAEVFDRAIANVIPAVEVRARRVGGSVYQVPVEVRALRGRALAFRSIMQAAKARSGKTYSDKLAAELIDAHENRGGAVKIKIDKHKMAEANRAFSHLVW